MLALARASLRRPVLTLLLFLLGTATVAAGLFRLEVRTDGSAIYPEGDPTVRQTLRDRVTFHDADLILLLVSARPGGPAVASPAGFRFLRRTDHELRRLPGVADPGLRSLPDLIEPPAKGTLNLVTPLDEIPDDPAAFAKLRTRLRAIPAAEGLFLS